MMCGSVDAPNLKQALVDKRTSEVAGVLGYNFAEQ